MGFMEAHIAGVGDGALHDGLERVCQAPLFGLLLLSPLCIHI